MAFPDLKRVLNRHQRVFENHAASGGAVHTQLMLLFAERQTGCIAFDQKRRNLVAIDAGEHGKEVSERRVGDPHFDAVQNVVFAIASKNGLRL